MLNVLAVTLVIGLTGPLLVPSAARADDCERHGSRPYGDYCQGRRWGRYGANDPVKSAGEARRRLEGFFEDEDVVVGKITERDSYFEAEIRDSAGELADRVIIDKRTGRIRSVY